MKLEPAISVAIEISSILMCISFFFFFQAEDGIRDPLVTGVQTCALPILGLHKLDWKAVKGKIEIDLGLRVCPIIPGKETGSLISIERLSISPGWVHQGAFEVVDDLRQVGGE